MLTRDDVALTRARFSSAATKAWPATWDICVKTDPSRYYRGKVKRVAVYPVRVTIDEPGIRKGVRYRHPFHIVTVLPSADDALRAAREYVPRIHSMERAIGLEDTFPPDGWKDVTLFDMTKPAAWGV